MTGLGSLYRSQHELVLVFKSGAGSHRNNVQLGQYGRNRTNVWKYQSANSFSRSGDEGNLFALHATVRPASLVADAIMDCTIRREVVLDGFLGSGASVIAAERTGRRCFGLEIDPIYVDVIVRRWQAFTRQTARHAQTERSFLETEAEVRGYGPSTTTASPKTTMSTELSWSTKLHRAITSRFAGCSVIALGSTQNWSSRQFGGLSFEEGQAIRRALLGIRDEAGSVAKENPSSAEHAPVAVTTEVQPQEEEKRIRPSEVGFGRPPVRSRFRKGRSGNPAGRPPAVKTFARLIRRLLLEKIRITENGCPRTVVRLQVVFEQIVNRAALGNSRFLKLLLEYIPSVDIVFGRKRKLRKNLVQILREG
ncbi:MAG: DUF5681 domain-containing protein [Candidatus Binatus sp.]|uniref:DUF5681 domain-containing protein n=1 Tax=Candidatus Binatus sp. TaxID=2811406 RepID=UPI003C78545F